MQPNSQRPRRRTITTDGFLTPQARSRKKNPDGTPKRQIGGPMPKKDGLTPRPNIALPVNQKRRPQNNPKAELKSSSLFETSPKNQADKKTRFKLFSRRKKTDDKKPQSRSRRIVKWSIIALATLLLLVAGWFGWRIYRSIAHITNNNNPFSLFGAFGDTKLRGQDSGRVNILLAGNSTDDPGHDGASLTDSIMVLSIDTNNHQAFILSIPRDLWVYISDLGYHEKINATGNAVDFSEAGYPDGGMGQLEKTIEDYLGLDINYYALINYTAFRDMVNAVGGITVNIQSSDSRGLYDSNISKADGGPLKLSNGWQELDGQTALNLARARGDGAVSYGFPMSDFDRTEHQRQMLLALKDKATGLNIITDTKKITDLFDAISKNITTDFKLNELVALYNLTKDINPSTIDSYNLNNINNQQLLSNYTTPDGRSALAPAAGVEDFSNIKKAIQKLTSNDPVVRESASVVVLNATEINGLAGRESQKLDYAGMNITVVSDAPNGYTSTIVVKNSDDKSGTANKLQDLYGVSASQDSTLQATYPSADFIIVLGTDKTWE